MDGCNVIWNFMSFNIHSLGTGNAGINVFWNVSIVWKDACSVFLFYQFAFVTSISIGALFSFIIQG
tara:strand:+ start:405 stop:602 length:198 start_codon:yes stop_codon:yes gene_type:complete